MKTYPVNNIPYSAALYLRKCEERKNSKACQRIDSFERIYRGACITIAGLATLFVFVALVQITVILSK